MLVFLSSADFGIGYELTPVNKRLAARYQRETGNESVLIQTDWDFPGLARSLGLPMKPGWVRSADGKRERCHHRGTDGTVKCPDCGMGASEFITYAAEQLDKRVDSVFRAEVEEYFGW